MGVVSLREALAAAAKVSLDLVEISPTAVPPVCKIMDFGRYKYDIKKKHQNSKKKQRVITTKEIKLRPNIGEHDLLIKLKSIQKFIEQGDKVKIGVRFKGREITHQELGMNLLKRVLEDVSPIAKAEVEPKFEGKQIFTLIAPK